MPSPIIIRRILQHKSAPASIAFPTLSGLVGRWNALNVITSSGNVTSATDLSGNGHALTNTGTVPLNATGYNGHPAFGFLAANQAGLSTTGIALTTATASVFIVCQMLTGTAANGGLASYADGNVDDWASNGGAAIIVRNNSDNKITTYGFSTQLGLNSISLATNYRLGIIFDGANVTQYINNVAQASPVAYTRSFTGVAPRFGIGNRIASGIFAGASGSAWEGSVAEIVLTSSALSGTELNNLDAYFTGQWGT